MPLSVETPAPVSTTQLPAARSRSARSLRRSANAREQVGERHVLERLDERSACERSSALVTSFGKPTQKMPAARAAAIPFGESSIAIASSALDAEQLERLEVERRARLAARRVAVGADDRRPAVARGRAAARFESIHERELLETMATSRPRSRASVEVARGRPGAAARARAARARGRRRVALTASRSHGASSSASSSSSSSGPVERADPQREAVERNRDAVRLEDLASTCAGRSTRCRRACRRSRRGVP